MRVKTTSVLCLVAGLSMLACSPPAEETGEDMDAQASSTEDRAALEQSVADWDAALNAGDLDALMATYASNPVALPPGGEPVRGAQAVRELWSGFMAQGDVTVENVVEVSRVSGDLGTAWGRYTLTIEPEGGETIEDAGKWMAISRRQADGSWKTSANIWNSDSERMPMGN